VTSSSRMLSRSSLPFVISLSLHPAQYLSTKDCTGEDERRDTFALSFGCSSGFSFCARSELASNKSQPRQVARTRQARCRLCRMLIMFGLLQDPTPSIPVTVVTLSFRSEEHRL